MLWSYISSKTTIRFIIIYSYLVIILFVITVFCLSKTLIPHPSYAFATHFQTQLAAFSECQCEKKIYYPC